jgi:hypothetical protein
MSDPDTWSATNELLRGCTSTPSCDEATNSQQWQVLEDSKMPI